MTNNLDAQILLELSLNLVDPDTDKVDLKKVLKKTVKLLNCNSGRIYFYEKDLHKMNFFLETSIPKRDKLMDQEVSKLLGDNLEVSISKIQQQKFPFGAEFNGTYTYFFYLEDFGVIVLKRNHTPFDIAIKRSLYQIFKKLAFLYKREKMEEEMKRTKHLLAIGMISSSVAHEIINPLMILRHNTTMLKRSLSLESKEQEERFENIENMASRISNIVQGLKNISYNEEDEPLEKIKLGELLEECEGIVDAILINNEVSVSYQRDLSDDLVINGRRTQISQVLINLIKNAIEEVQRKDDPWIKVEVQKESDRITIKVIDSGDGISLENQAKILGHGFFTTKGKGKGTGIGVSLSKRLLESQNATLRIDNSAKNTTFCMDFFLT